MQKRQAPSGLDYFKNLERKNEGPETKKQAELSSVLTKPKPKQNQKQPKIKTKPETNPKINKIDKYLVELKPEPNLQPTNPTTNHQNSPAKLSIMEKIKKFSSRSPPKLPPLNRNSEPNQKTAIKPTENQQDKETKPNQQQPDVRKPNKKPSSKKTGKQPTGTNIGQQQQQQDDASNNKSKPNNQTKTTTNETITKTTNQKPKPAKPNKMRNPTTETKSQHQPDIKLFLAKKKLEIGARAAAKLQPTQVRIKCNLPSQDVTSARSKPDDDSGGIADIEGRPNQMTL